MASREARAAATARRLRARTTVSRVRRIALGIGGLVLLVVLAAGLYVGVVLGATKYAVAGTDGTRTGLPIAQPLTIARDERGVPHVRALSDLDLYFAQGYAEAQDRLFQMDVLRRYTTGRLAEMLGAPLASTDLSLRRWGIARYAQRAYANASREDRAMLDAFSAGVNAAARAEPLPPEFRALGVGFETWKPADSLAVSLSTVLDLVDDDAAIAMRDALARELGPRWTSFMPFSDTKYDAPTAAGPAVRTRNVALAPLGGAHAPVDVADVESREGIGSNAWGLGAAHVEGGHAVICNDPHLRTSIPGVWWMFEGASPSYHVAGATLVGVPGIVLGHNAHVAWGVTNGGTLAMQVLRERVRNGDELFEGGTWVKAAHRRETVHVRLGADRTLDVLETPRGIAVEHAGDVARIVVWPWLLRANSPLNVVRELARSRSADEAATALRAWGAPVQNFVLADDRGRVGYRLGGDVLSSPAGSVTSASGDGPAPSTALVPFAAMPHVPPSRDAVVWTANNTMVDDHYPYRLAAHFAAPYRAYEIHRRLMALLATHPQATPDEIADVQRDVTSPADLEVSRELLAAVDRAHAAGDPSLARIVAALRDFNGAIAPDSRAATAIVAARAAATRDLAASHLTPEAAAAWLAHGPAAMTLVRALRERPRGWFAHDDVDTFALAALRHAQTHLGDEVPPFGRWFAVPLKHALAPFGFTLWNGPVITGHGGALAPAVQGRTEGQSFRATWVAGDWDRSTLDIPAGESGEPGSPHYADLTARWNAFARTPLPFTDTAVFAATRHTLILRP